MDNAQEYYDRHSSDYVEKWRELENISQPADVYRRNMVANLIEMAGIRSDQRIAEIGAGTGLVLRELLKETSPIVGTDVSIEMLRRAREVLADDWRVTLVETLPEQLDSADVYLVRDDVNTSSLPPARFDVILSMEVFRYVGDLDLAFTNVRAALVEGGMFAFSVTNRWSLGLFPLKYELRRVLGRVNLDAELAQHFVTEQYIRRTLGRAGFEVDEIRKLNCLTFNPITRRFVHTTAGAARTIAIDKRLERIPGVNLLFDTLLLACRAV